MIAKLARRLGFRPSVPAAIVDAWTMAQPTTTPIHLAPRGGQAGFVVDEFGRVQPDGETWSVELTLAAGARWVPASQSERVRQKLLSPAVVETTIATPSGSIVHRAGAAVVGGRPVAIIEVENTGGVAIAVGLVARPLVSDGRGYIGNVACEPDRFEIDGRIALGYQAAPATTKALAGADGDLLAKMPEATAASLRSASKCRSGGAQGAAVWPLPHTATLRVVVELTGPAAATKAVTPAAVPSLDDVNRGWQVHLKTGLQVDVGGTDIAEGLAVSARTLLTCSPRATDSARVVKALAELGFAKDAAAMFGILDRFDDDLAVLQAVARWFQLSDHTERHAELDGILGATARAAHTCAASRSPVPAGPWFDAAKLCLRGGLHTIGQPDVGASVVGLQTRSASAKPAIDRFAQLTKDHDDRWHWGPSHLASATRYVSAVRELIIDDRGLDLRLLPDLPVRWRGQTIDVLGAPIQGGSLSFGLRWHGSRPALLWEVDLVDGDAPIELSVPGVDPDFVTTELEGETLLADPGWK